MVELIVASIVGVLVAGATATALSQLFRARTTSSDHEQAFSRAHDAAARIALDLTNALRRSDPIQQKVAVINGGAPGQERDELLMLTRSLRPLRGDSESPEGDEYEVQYRVMPAADGRDALWRRRDMAYDEYVDAGGIASPITGGMVALSIQANDGTDEWLEEWDSDSDGLPHAVRISVTAQSDDGRARSTAIRLVALDRVPIPPPADTSDSTNGANSGNSNSSGGSSGTSGGSSSGGSTRSGGGFTTTTPRPTTGGTGGGGGGRTQGGGGTGGGGRTGTGSTRGGT